MRFHLGTHQTGWLADERFAGVPLFVSRRRLIARKSLPRAVTEWALDSGGFTELLKFGRWTVTPSQYADEVRTWSDRIGRMRFAAIMDWMCEEQIIRGGAISGATAPGTGLTLRGHQERTVGSWLDLRALAPEIPWLPVLQGFTLDEYLACLEMYDEAGFDLAAMCGRGEQPGFCGLVGLGSVCRRQATGEAEVIVRELAGLGLRLHGFGFKTQAIPRVSKVMASADSMAWSLNARKHPPMDGCTHKSCGNCPRWALRWYARVRDRIDEAIARPVQGMLF